MSQPSYYSVIPAPVRYSNTLCTASKLLFGEITSLCNERGYCWATNRYFADLYEVHPDTISEWVRQLATWEFIRVEFVPVPAKGKERRIYISERIPHLPDRTPPAKTPDPPVGENAGGARRKCRTMNNTSNKGTSNEVPGAGARRGRRSAEVVTQEDIAGYVFPPPLDDPRFNAAVERWRVHKARRVEYLTRYGLELLVKRCQEWGVDDAMTNIDHSIAANWQGAFPARGGRTVDSKAGQTVRTDRAELDRLNAVGLETDRKEERQRGEFEDEA